MISKKVRILVTNTTPLKTCRAVLTRDLLFLPKLVMDDQLDDASRGRKGSLT